MGGCDGDLRVERQGGDQIGLGGAVMAFSGLRMAFTVLLR
jgi:hypothetical protein